MKTRWLLPGLLPGLLGFFLAASPALAARLESWRFDRNQNRLEFRTNEGVRPRAQLIQNPTRLVIDLPGVTLNQPLVNQPIGGAIQALRVSQFDPQTTRLVVELAPGYTLDPQLIQIRGLSPRQWTVQLPTPQLDSSTPPTNLPDETPNPNPLPSPLPNSPISPNPTSPPLNPTPNAPLATIQAVDLDPNSGQLIIRSDQAFVHSTRWQGAEYQITLSPARLAENVRGPQLTSTSPVSRLRLRQDDPQTVVILVQPALGVRIGDLSLVTPRTLALGFRRSSLPLFGQPNPTMPTGPMPSIPQGRFVVVIDPGHGGPDPGAIGIGGVREKDVVLLMAQQVAGILQQQGIQVYMTRNNDADVDLEPRVQMAQQVNATIFVSIHANAFRMDRPDINGLETYYYSTGAALARVVHQNILQSIRISDRGVRSSRFYVLRRTSMPSILIETGYLTGRDDAPRLANANFRSQMATAIARGILQYLRSGG